VFDDEFNDEEELEWKTHRRVMYFLGKGFKYTVWAASVYFFYHLYVVAKKDRPEEAAGVHKYFLDQAMKLNGFIQDMTMVLTRPPIDKLLPNPPPLPPGAIWPKTIILNLRGTLVHSEYKFGEGFQFRKRPGLNAFLKKLSTMYEVVVFGDEESVMVNELCEALDPQYQIFSGRFGHEHTLLKDGKYIKDLSYMNRDVNKIVVIDVDDAKVAYHKDNVILLPPWEGDKEDRALIDLVPFLEHLAKHGNDVKQELQLFTRDRTAERFNEIQRA
jgi:import inner membrane translocase subunit TIM50